MSGKARARGFVRNVSAQRVKDAVKSLVWTFDFRGFFTTIDLSVDYFASARLGEVVTARARVVKPGQRVIHAECDLANAEGRILARGRTNLLRVEKRAYAGVS